MYLKTVGNVNQSKVGGDVWDVPFEDVNHLQGPGWIQLQRPKDKKSRSLDDLLFLKFIL